MYELSVDIVEYSLDRKTQEPIIHVFGRTVDGVALKIDVTGFYPYFYTSENPNIFEQDEWVKYVSDTTFQTIHGKEAWKVVITNPYLMRTAREKFIHYEADIKLNERFTIDLNITSGIRVPSIRCHWSDIEPINIHAPSRICTIDIEADDRDGSFPTPEENMITAITCHDSFTDCYDIFYLINEENPIDDIECLTSTWVKQTNAKIRLHTFSVEQSMMIAFTNYINTIDADILTGWNFTEFDLPYIMKRMMVLELNPMDLGRMPARFDSYSKKLRGRSVFDMLGGYKKLQESAKPSYRLDAVADDEIGEHKLHFSGLLYSLWKDNPNKFINYNWKDVELCVNIDKKLHIIEFCKMLAQYVGTSIDHALANSKIVDLFVLKRAHGRFVLPSAPSFRPNSEKFKGATVMDPFSGIEENVAVLDFTSLYPMILDTINASPETKNKNGEYRAPNGIRFKKSPDGITRDIMRYLFNERKHLKKERDTHESTSDEYKLLDMQQRVIKEIMNSYYGVSGYIRFRLYDKDTGAAVTSVGRAVIEHAKEIAKKAGFDVLYGDSVGHDSKITVYDENGTYIDKIDISKLFKNVNYKKSDGREYSSISNLYTDTIDKYGKHKLVRIKYIMRHKANKKIYRVHLNNCTYIDVTEDHSLFGYLPRHKSKNLLPHERIIPIKPNEIGTKINSIIVKKYKKDEKLKILKGNYDNRAYQDFSISSVKEIGDITEKYNNYVYDIEVDDDAHRFFANNILVHNTDSLLIKLNSYTKEDALKEGFLLEEIINSSCDEFAKKTLGVEEHKFNIKFEKLYKRFMQAGKKKRYAVHIIWKEGVEFDKIDIIGFEFRRSDVSLITKKTQQKLIEMLINGDTETDIKKFLRDVITKYRKGKYTLDEIGVPGGISKNLEHYLNKDSHVRGAEYANKYLGANFKSGSKPKHVYIKYVKHTYPRTDVICFEYGDEVPEEFVIDYETMLEKSLKNPIIGITKEVLHLDWKNIDPQITTLATFGLED